MPKHRVVEIVSLAKSEWRENVKVDPNLVHKLEEKSYKQLQKIAIKLGIDHHISKSALILCILAERNIFFPQETGYVNRTLVHMVKQLTNYKNPEVLTNSKLRSLLTTSIGFTQNMGSYLLRMSRLYENILFTEESWCSQEVRQLISAEQNGISLQSYIRFMISRNLELFEAWKLEQNQMRKQIISEEMEIRRENLDKATEEYLHIIKSYCSTGCTIVPEEMKKWAKKPRFKTTLIVCNTQKDIQKLKFKLGDTFANGFTIDKIIEKNHIVWLGLGKFFIAGAYWTNDNDNEDSESKENYNSNNSQTPQDPQIIQMPPGFVVTSEAQVFHKVAQPQSIGLVQPLVFANALQYYEQQPTGITMGFQSQSNIPHTVTNEHNEELLNNFKTTALTLVKEGLQFSAEQLLQFVLQLASLHTHSTIMSSMSGTSTIITLPPPVEKPPQVEITLVSTKPLQISNVQEPISHGTRREDFSSVAPQPIVHGNRREDFSSVAPQPIVHGTRREDFSSVAPQPIVHGTRREDFSSVAPQPIVHGTRREDFSSVAPQPIVHGIQREDFSGVAPQPIIHGIQREDFSGVAPQPIIHGTRREDFSSVAPQPIIHGTRREDFSSVAPQPIIHGTHREDFSSVAPQPIVHGTRREDFSSVEPQPIVHGTRREDFSGIAPQPIVHGTRREDFTRIAPQPIVHGTRREDFTGIAPQPIVHGTRREEFSSVAPQPIVHGTRREEFSSVAPQPIVHGTRREDFSSVEPQPIVHGTRREEFSSVSPQPIVHGNRREDFSGIAPQPIVHGIQREEFGSVAPEAKYTSMTQIFQEPSVNMNLPNIQTSQDHINFQTAENRLNQVLNEQNTLAQQQIQLQQESEKLESLEELRQLVQEFNLISDQQHELFQKEQEIKLDYQALTIQDHTEIVQEIDQTMGVKARVTLQKQADLQKARNEEEKQILLNQLVSEKLQTAQLVTDLKNQLIYISKNIQDSIDLTLTSIAEENERRKEVKQQELEELNIEKQKQTEKRIYDENIRYIQEEYKRKIMESKIREENLQSKKLQLQQKLKNLAEKFHARTGQSLVAVSKPITLVDTFPIRDQSLTTLQRKQFHENLKNHKDLLYRNKSLLQKQELQRYKVREYAHTLETMLQSYLHSQEYENAFRVIQPVIGILPFVLESPSKEDVPLWAQKRAIQELDQLIQMYGQNKEVNDLKMALLRGIAEIPLSNTYRIHVKDDDLFHAASNIVHYVKNQKHYNPQTLEFFGQLLNAIHENKSIDIDPSVKMKIASGDLKLIHLSMKNLVDHQTQSFQRKASDPIIKVMKEMSRIIPNQNGIGFFPDFMFLITDNAHTRLVDTGSQTIIAIDTVMHNPDSQVASLQSVITQVVDIPKVVNEMIQDTDSPKMDSMVSKLWDAFDSISTSVDWHPNYYHIIQSYSMAHYVKNSLQANIVLPVVSTVSNQFDLFISTIVSTSSTAVTYLKDTSLAMKDQITNLKQIQKSDPEDELVYELVTTFMEMQSAGWSNMQNAEPVTSVSLLETTLHKYSQIYDPLQSMQFDNSSVFLVLPDQTNQIKMTLPTIKLESFIVVNPFTTELENMFTPNNNDTRTNANLWGTSVISKEDTMKFENLIQGMYRYESSTFLEKALNTHKISPSTAFNMSHVRLGNADKLFYEIVSSLSSVDLRISEHALSEMTRASSTNVIRGTTISEVISNAFQASQVSDSFIKVLVDIPIAYKPIANRIILALSLVDEVTIEYVDQIKTWAAVRNKSKNAPNLIKKIELDEVFSNFSKDIPVKMQHPQNYAWEITIHENGEREFWIHDKDELSLQMYSFTTNRDKSYTIAKASYALLTTDKLTNPNWQDPEEILMRVDEIVGFAQALKWDNPQGLSNLISSIFINQGIPNEHVHNRVLQRFQIHDDIMDKIMLTDLVIHPGAHMLHLLNAQNGNKNENLIHLVNQLGITQVLQLVNEWMYNQNPEVAKKLSNNFSNLKWNPILESVLKLATWAQLANIKTRELTSEEYFKLQPRTIFQAIRDCVSQSLVIPSETMTLENLDTSYKLQAGPTLENMEDVRFIGSLSYLIQQMALQHPDKHYTFQLFVNLYLAASPQELTPKLIFNAITTAIATLESMKKTSIAGPWNQTAIDTYESLKFYGNLSPIPNFGNYFGVLKGDDVVNIMNTTQEIINVPINHWGGNTRYIIDQLILDINPLRDRYQSAIYDSKFRHSFKQIKFYLAETCKLSGCDIYAYMWNSLVEAGNQAMMRDTLQSQERIKKITQQQAQVLSQEITSREFWQEQINLGFTRLQESMMPNPAQVALEENWKFQNSNFFAVLRIFKTPPEVIDLLLGTLITGEFGSSLVRETIKYYLPESSPITVALLEFAGLFVLKQGMDTISVGLRIKEDTFISLTPSLMTTQQKINLNQNSLAAFAYCQSVSDQVLFSKLPNYMRTELLSQDQFNIAELFASMTSKQLADDWILGNIPTSNILESLSSKNIMNSADVLESAQVLFVQNLVQQPILDTLMSKFAGQMTRELHFGIPKSTIVSGMAEIVSNMQIIQTEFLSRHEQVFRGFLETGRQKVRAF
jgi:hypothetical protein